LLGNKVYRINDISTVTVVSCEFWTQVAYGHINAKVRAAG